MEVLSVLLRWMDVMLVLLVSFVVLRGVGWLGVERLSSWRAAGLGAVAIMFVVTGVSHCTSMKYDFAAMMPEPLPDDLWVIYLSGVFWIAGAVGLLIPRTRRLAGICLVLLLVAVFPANVNAALNGIPFGGEAPTPLWLRTPMQLLFIGMLWWTSIKARREETGRRPTREPVVELVDGTGHASADADSNAGTHGEGWIKGGSRR